MRNSTLLGLIVSVLAAPVWGANTTPYFASIKSDKIYMRLGPGEEYPIKWVYHRKGLPVEVLASYDAWGRGGDMEGETGGIHRALLPRERTAVVTGEKIAAIQRSA